MIGHPLRLFLVALLLAAAALLPMRVLLAAAGPARLPFSADAIDGPFWNATARNARWRELALGDVDLTLRPLALFRGALGLRARSREIDLDIEFGHRAGLHRADGLLQLPPRAGLPLTAVLEAGALRAVFADGRCVDAGGTLEALLTPVDASAWAPVRLTATPGCDGDAWVARLTPPDGAAPAGPPVEARIEVRADGSFRTQATFASSDPATRLALAARGFEAQDPARMVRSVSGRLFD